MTLNYVKELCDQVQTPRLSLCQRHKGSLFNKCVLKVVQMLQPPTEIHRLASAPFYGVSQTESFASFWENTVAKNTEICTFGKLLGKQKVER